MFWHVCESEKDIQNGFLKSSNIQVAGQENDIRENKEKLNLGMKRRMYARDWQHRSCRV